MLIRLRGCAGWSAPLLFAYGINRFSHDVAHITTRPPHCGYIPPHRPDGRLQVSLDLCADNLASTLLQHQNPEIKDKKWATSWENLFYAICANKDADQPAHLCSLISIFIVRCLDSTIPILAISKISRLASFWSRADGLSVTWS